MFYRFFCWRKNIRKWNKNILNKIRHMYRRPSNEFEKSLNLLKIYYKTQQNVIFLTRMEFIKIEWLYVASIGNIITDKVCNPHLPTLVGFMQKICVLFSKTTKVIHCGTATKIYFKKFIDLFFLYLVHKHQTWQGLLLFYQRWTQLQ